MIIAFVYQAIIGVIGGVVTVVLVLNIGIPLLVIAAIRKWQKRGGESITYYSKPHLVYMQCSYAMLMNAEHQHTTAAVQTYNIAPFL